VSRFLEPAAAAAGDDIPEFSRWLPGAWLRAATRGGSGPFDDLEITVPVDRFRELNLTSADQFSGTKLKLHSSRLEIFQVSVLAVTCGQLLIRVK
jgi:hypothetical protein